MKRNLRFAALLLVLFLACVTAAFASCPSTEAKDENTLLLQEETWAKALDEHDSATIDCLLAAEFQDADVNGATHERTEALAHVSQPRSGSNHLEQMKARVYGDTAFVRGLNRVMDPSGKAVASVRFTDIFIYRDGRWQAVAGQETFLTEKEK
jgi:Domain of unknown function (DUF4440)